MKNKFLLLAAVFLYCTMNTWASGYSIKKTHFYYDNTRSGWETNENDSIMIYFHKNGYGAAYSMKRVENTNLYYYYRDGEWKDAKEIAFIFINIANKSNFTGASASRSASGSLGYTGFQTLSSDLDSKYCLARPTGETFVDNAELHWDTKSEWGTESADNDLRKAVLYRTQTLKVYLSTDGSTYSSSSGWFGSFSVNRYLFQDTKKTTTDASVKNLSTTDKTVTGIRSSKQTFTESNTTEGYRFKGWGRSNSAPTNTENPYVFTVEANAADIYAFFEQGRTINIEVADGQEGLGNVNVASVTCFTGDAPTIIATCTNPLYVFDYWEVTAGTATLANPSASSTSITSASSNSTIKAHFRLRGTVNFTISAARYASWYGLDNLVIPDGITAQYVSDWSNTILTWESLSSIIPAEEGVILSGEPGTYVAYITSETEQAEGNMLKGTLSEEVINNACVHYILSAESDGNRVGLYWPNEATVSDETGVGLFTNKAHKAYLELPANGASLAPRRYVFGAYNTTTDVENLYSPTTEIQKMMENGVLYIIKNGIKYNTQGQIVK